MKKRAATAKTNAARKAARPKARSQRKSPAPRAAAADAVASTPATLPTHTGVTSAAGYHRIYAANGEDTLVAYVPLDEARRLATSGAKPWLLKLCLDGYDWFGELESENGDWNRIVWSTDDPDTFTDLGKATLRGGAVIRLRDGDGRTWSLPVRHLARV